MQLLNVAFALMLGSADASGPRHNSVRLATSKYANVDLNFEAWKYDDAIAPKAFVVSLFEPEMAVWHKRINFTNNITVPGLSPLFPQVYCTEDYDLCNFVTGEGEINAAASVTALLASPQFNLSETYFLVAGIAGIDPAFGALGSATFARFAISVGLQYEVDARQAPKNWSTGYWAYGTDQPGKPPKTWYGTEAFELNENLRDRAAELATNATLTTSNVTLASIANKTNSLFNLTATRQAPKILKCDVATSDVYFTGSLLGNATANFTKNVTNGTATYCMTAQEDSAILEAVLRNAQFGLTDYSRWVILRTASDYDRAPARLSNDSVGFFLYNNTGGYEIALENLYSAGMPFIKDVLQQWNSTYINGTTIVNSTVTPNGKNGTFAAPNYVGDVFGTLGGKPDFGPGSAKDFAYI